MPNIVVTGGCGFIGSNLVNKLSEDDNNEIRVIDNFRTGKREFIIPRPNVSIVNQDITKEVFIPEEVNIVYHLAAQANLPESMKNPSFDASTNVIGTLNVIQAMPKTARLIFTSTSTVYGRKGLPWKETYAKPECAYGLSKLTAENYIKMLSPNYAICRLPNIFGPNQTNVAEAGIIAILFENFFKNKETILYGDGQAERVFLYVKDLVNMLIYTSVLKNNFIVNIAPTWPWTINQCLEIMQTQTDIPINEFKIKRVKEYRGAWEVQKAEYDERKFNKIFRNFAEVKGDNFITLKGKAFLETFEWNKQYWKNYDLDHKK